jgi:two-component system sensor histidine kinase KdpD
MSVTVILVISIILQFTTAFLALVRVERILYNLLENATKYSPAQSEIKVSARKKGNLVITEVNDQGRGITRAEKDRLFELFMRLEESLNTKGAGLGLVVCKRLVEARGGVD